MPPGRAPAPRGQGPRGGRSHPRRGARPGQRGWRAAAGSRARAVASTRPRLTGRAAVLVLVLAALMVSYASSLRAYVEQRRHLGALEEQIERSEQTIADLQREKRRWQDDAYVVSQARARFAFGFPGEVGYRVLDEDGKPLDHDSSLSDPQPLEDPEPEWWQTTLTSIEEAGHPRPDVEPADRIVPPKPTEDDREREQR